MCSVAATPKNSYSGNPPKNEQWKSRFSKAARYSTRVSNFTFNKMYTILALPSHFWLLPTAWVVAPMVLGPHFRLCLYFLVIWFKKWKVIWQSYFFSLQFWNKWKWQCYNSIAVQHVLFDFGLKKNIQQNACVSTLVPWLLYIRVI